VLTFFKYIFDNRISIFDKIVIDFVILKVFKLKCTKIKSSNSIMNFKLDKEFKLKCPKSEK